MALGGSALGRALGAGLMPDKVWLFSASPILIVGGVAGLTAMSPGAAVCILGRGGRVDGLGNVTSTPFGSAPCFKDLMSPSIVRMKDFTPDVCWGAGAAGKAGFAVGGWLTGGVGVEADGVRAGGITGLILGMSKSFAMGRFGGGILESGTKKESGIWNQESWT